MYPVGVEILGLGAVVIWLSVVTIWLFKQQRFLKKLFPGRIGNFRSRIEDVFKEVEKIDDFRTESLKNIQKVALVRFNPYHDTGGNQSFILALLDGEGTGILLTSMHSRAGTRMFAKPIEKGKADVELSGEEQKAISQALKS